jgi:excisionase family DNA binding protein
MGSNQNVSGSDGALALVPLPDAIKPYKGVTRRQLLALIHSGRLPAARVGRAFLVSPADVANLFQPKLQPAPARKVRESETARVERQLANAGIV